MDPMIESEILDQKDEFLDESEILKENENDYLNNELFYENEMYLENENLKDLKITTNRIIELYDQKGILTRDPKHIKPTLQDVLSIQILTVAFFYLGIEGRNEKCILALRQSISLNYYLSEAHYNMGCYYASTQDPESALECFLVCVEQSPRFFDAVADLGALYLVLRQYHKAISTLEKAIEIDEKNFVIHYNKASSHQLLEQWKQAGEHFRKSLKFNPDQPNALYACVQCDFNSQNYSQCIEMIEVYLQTNPKDAKALFLIGCAHMELKQKHSAINSFEMAIHYKTDYLDPLINLGMLYYADAEFDKSLNYLEKVLSIDPTIYQVHTNLGQIFRIKNEPEKAIYHFETAISINPEASGEAYVNLGILYFVTGNSEVSKINLDKAFVHFPNSIEVNYYLGKYYESIGDKENSKFYFQTTYKFSLNGLPNDLFSAVVLLDQKKYKDFQINLTKSLKNISQINLSLLINIASLLKETGRTFDSIQIYKTLLNSFPQNAIVHYNLAQVYKFEEFDEKIKHLGLALEINPSMFDARVQIANLFMQNNNLQKAVENYKLALDLNQNSPQTWHAYADCLVEIEQYHKAQQAYNQVIRMNPEESDAYIGVAISFYHLGRFKDSEMAIYQAIEISPNNPYAYYNLSFALVSQKKKKEAQNALEKAIQLMPDFSDALMDLGLILLEEYKNDNQILNRAKKLIQNALSIDPSLKKKLPKTQN